MYSNKFLHPLGNKKNESSSEYAPDDMKRQLVSAFCTMDYSVDPGRTSALTKFCGIQLGPVDIFRHDGFGRRFGGRNSYHVRSNWVDDFVVTLPLAARATTTQCGRVANCDPGTFSFVSMTKPYTAELSGAGSQSEFSAIIARVSGPLLRKHVPHIDEYCSLPIHAGSGAGKIMRSLFEMAIAEGETLSGQKYISDLLFLGIANVAADIGNLTTKQKPIRISASTRLRRRAIDFIDSHLSDPELVSGHVAAHCRVSIRSLQLSFAAASMTVESYIRESRLLECRASLRHPDLTARSINQVAQMWGFTDPAYFSRLYKTRFGLTPMKDRYRPVQQPDS